MTQGHIRQRSPGSWEIKFEAGRDPVAGKRKTRYVTIKGNKKAAQQELRRLLGTLDEGTYVDPSKVTVAEHVRARVSQWEGSGKISAKTAERYSELIENQIVPHLGTKQLQKLRPADIENWHSALRTSG